MPDMNIKFMVPILILMTVLMLLGCENRNEEDSDDVVLTFSELYELSEDDNLKKVEILEFSKLEKGSNQIEATDDVKQKLYHYFLNLEVHKVEPQVMSKHKTSPQYLLYFNVNQNDKKISFNIALGESYMDFSYSDDTMIYAHDISKSDYEELIKIFNK